MSTEMIFCSFSLDNCLLPGVLDRIPIMPPMKKKAKHTLTTGPDRTLAAAQSTERPVPAIAARTFGGGIEPSPSEEWLQSSTGTERSQVTVQPAERHVAAIAVRTFGGGIEPPAVQQCAPLYTNPPSIYHVVSAPSMAATPPSPPLIWPFPLAQLPVTTGHLPISGVQITYVDRFLGIQECPDHLFRRLFQPALLTIPVATCSGHSRPVRLQPVPLHYACRHISLGTWMYLMH